ncbi:MAG: hypothetical protein LCI00_18515 [Chloroflexi bacterium]|nr:hypothetical protein [Chloroflexota bacterium]MCC6894506.1 hypothetical protein [Anaerolineae bacterium]
MMTFLRTRLFILLPLLCTFLALYGLLSRQAYDSEWMLRWNQIDTAQVQLVYGVLIVVLVLALPLARRIQSALWRGRGVVLLLAAVASFLSITMLEPNQEHRLFITPFSVWIIIAHGIALCLIAAWYAFISVSEEPLSINRRWLIGFVMAGIGLLLVLHVLSVGEFMQLDLPDEPWLTSMATNYAENNDLSPAFIGSSYGTPDPILPRYYGLMGMWLRIAGSSVVALRLMPLLVMVFVVVLVALILWRTPTFSPLQRWVGLLVLLSLTPLVRMSHNLRADIGLAVYGAIMLGVMLHLFSEQPAAKRWATLGGAALYLGLETIPFIALILAAVVGGMLILWLFRQKRLRNDWLVVVSYAVCCALALALYAAVRFLPDVQGSWLRYQRFSSVYSGQTGFGALRFPLESLLTYHLRFSLILSPVECGAVLAALVAGWRWGTTTLRWILLTFGIALLLMLTAVSFTFGYWTLFVPLVAYVVASVFTTQRVLVVGAVALPAMIAAPVMDLWAAIQTRPNQTALQAVDPLVTRIPTELTVIGENILWFPLHSQRTFMGVDGFWINQSGHPELTVNENIERLDVEALICVEGNQACDLIVESGLFQPPEIVTLTTNQTYRIFWRKP